jgi:hypothetical protein
MFIVGAINMAVITELNKVKELTDYGIKSPDLMFVGSFVYAANLPCLTYRTTRRKLLATTGNRRMPPESGSCRKRD